VWKLIKAEFVYNWQWIAHAYFLTFLLALLNPRSSQGNMSEMQFAALVVFLALIEIHRIKKENKIRFYGTLPVSLTAVSAARLMFPLLYWFFGMAILLTTNGLASLETGQSADLATIIYFLDILLLFLTTAFIFDDISHTLKGWPRLAVNAASAVVLASLFIVLIMKFLIIDFIIISGADRSGAMAALDFLQSVPLLLTVTVLESALLLFTGFLFTKRTSFME